jgi:uncharacterized membrane protein YphA (DoxX/SURF4 family)
MFGIQGIAKLTSSTNWVTRFRAWGYPDHFYFVIGAVEVVGAMMLLVPKLAGFGGIILICVMIGATATHVLNDEPQVLSAVMIMALLMIVTYMRRSSLQSLLGRAIRQD